MSKPRPFTTNYEDGHVAHSATPQGAMVAAFRQIVNKHHRHCTIHHGRTLLCRIWPEQHSPRTLSVLYYPSRFEQQLRSVA
jgi:phenylpropionate dioxygenase-like ring-hydroxylating dioxygenase large terminal subunit